DFKLAPLEELEFIDLSRRFLEQLGLFNTDGSVKSVDKFIVVGGIRNQNGKWIIKFNRYLGNCAVLDYKLWGILDGLKIALDRSFQRVSIQTDSLEVVNLIYEDVRRDSNFVLVRRIHMLLKCLSH
ncbi:hypothetical protein Goshw_027841, partial [Gossypium schwendimanii]|nr:hypothetical protein [Gossypium schwendimanii]